MGFFLSFNKDSDLYVGQQQGDNGQSLVLGGKQKTPDGRKAVGRHKTYLMLCNKPLDCSNGFIADIVFHFASVFCGGVAVNTELYQKLG